MTHHPDMRRPAVRVPAELPPGMLEYECRTAIRDLIRVHGFEAARELVAHYLNDEADRKPRT